MPTISETLETMVAAGKPPMAVALIAADGSHRVWLSADFCHVDNYEWVQRQFIKASTTALAMQPGAGHA